MAYYPIWNDVTACIYESDKSWGAKEDCKITVLAGNRDRSSIFVEHCTTHRISADGTQEFRFYLDNKCVKRATLKPKGCLETLPIDC